MNALVAALATRRLTYLITQDKLTEPARNAWLQRHPRDTQLGYLAECPRCVSVWAGLATLLLLALPNNRVGRVIVKALALSETVILTDTLLDRQDTGFRL